MVSGPVALSADTYQPTVSQHGIVLVFWWADWSGPCRKFAPVFGRAAQEHQDLTFATVDTLTEAGLAAAMQVSAIPDLMVYRDGILVYEVAVMLSANELDEVIRAARAVDMAEVARQLQG